MQLETVKVVSEVSEDNPHGYIVINKSDLTDDHKLFVEAEEKPARGKAAKQSEG
jgi:hypothetical protein